MTQTNILDSFERTKRELVASFPPHIGRRLTRVRLRFRKRSQTKWVAYFDANRGELVVNLPRLLGRSRTFLTTVMTHELLHAAAEHHRRKKHEVIQLKAGLRLEIFSPRKRTENEHLNEAFVSLLTRTRTGTWDNHYLLEQLVLQALMKKMGQAPLERAFFEDDWHAFIRNLEETFGRMATIDVLKAFEYRRFDRLQKYLVN